MSDKLMHEAIEDLAATIARAREEIAAIEPGVIKTHHIAPSHDELDAVVRATEDATNKIMDECEKIQGVAAQCVPEAAAAIATCVTSIFEACNFQDITGQRITKVVGALKQIDQKIDALLDSLGADTAAVSAAQKKGQLLNGPQLPGDTPTQEDINKLFGS